MKKTNMPGQAHSTAHDLTIYFLFLPALLIKMDARKNNEHEGII